MSNQCKEGKYRCNECKQQQQMNHPNPMMSAGQQQFPQMQGGQQGLASVGTQQDRANMAVPASLQQLLYTLKSPNSPQEQAKVLGILKHHPEGMTEIIKLRQQQLRQQQQQQGMPGMQQTMQLGMPQGMQQNMQPNMQQNMPHNMQPGMQQQKTTEAMGQSHPALQPPQQQPPRQAMQQNMAQGMLGMQQGMQNLSIGQEDSPLTAQDQLIKYIENL